MLRIFHHLADETLRRENAKLRRQLADVENELERQRRTNSVQATELDKLAAVAVRDLERVKAETADAIRRREHGQK